MTQPVPNHKTPWTKFKLKMSNGGVLYVAVLALIVAIIIGVNSVLYANRIGEKSDKHAEEQVHNFCEIINLFDNAYKTAPPATPTGKLAAEAMNNLKVRLHC